MLLLFLYITAILAMGLFGDCPRDGAGLNHNYNFETFGSSMVYMFIVTTGDGWSDAMYRYIFVVILLNHLYKI